MVRELLFAMVLSGPGQPGGQPLAVDGWPALPARLSAGEESRWEFEVRNTGSEPVEVVRVTTSCPCLTVELPSRRLPPGAGMIGVAWVRPESGKADVGVIRPVATIAYKAGTKAHALTLSREIDDSLQTTQDHGRMP